MLTQICIKLVRRRLVKALIHGNTSAATKAWQQYQTLADTYIERLSNENNIHAAAQVMLMVGKAQIWLEAKEPVRYLQELIDARNYANNVGFRAFTTVISADIEARGQSPEFDQAMGDYEVAIQGYIDREQQDISDRARGFLNLRLTECYRALLEQDPGNNELTALHDGSIETALVYLAGEPEQGKALQLISEQSR